MIADQNNLPYLLTSRDLAALLQVSASALERMRARRQVPDPIRIGRRLRWRRDVVLSWLEESRTPRKNTRGVAR